MSAELRTEFEEYVSQLTTAICKEVLLEQMREQCSQYEELAAAMGQTAEKINASAGALNEGVEGTRNALSAFERDTGKTMEGLALNVADMRFHTDLLFQQTRKTNALNREELVGALSDQMERYTSRVGETLEAGCERMSGVMARGLTAEQLRDFVEQLQFYTEANRALAGYVNGGYREEVESGIRAIFKAQEASREEYARSLVEEMENSRRDLEDAFDGAVEIYARRMNSCFEKGREDISRMLARFDTPAELETFYRRLETFTESNRALLDGIRETSRQEAEQGLRSLSSELEGMKEQLLASLNAYAEEQASGMRRSGEAGQRALREQTDRFAELFRREQEELDARLSDLAAREEQRRKEAQESQKRMIQTVEAEEAITVSILRGRMDELENASRRRHIGTICIAGALAVMLFFCLTGIWGLARSILITVVPLAFAVFFGVSRALERQGEDGSSGRE